MKPTIEQKALAACREYVRLNALIRQLTRDIGGNLSLCLGNGQIDTDSEGFGYPRTHLREMWSWVGVSRENLEKARAEFKTCPHCVKADELIQQRKAARLSLGAAKRQITKIGKEAA